MKTQKLIEQVRAAHPNYTTGKGGRICDGCKQDIEAIEGDVTQGWHRHLIEATAKAVSQDAPQMWVNAFLCISPRRDHHGRCPHQGRVEVDPGVDHMSGFMLHGLGDCTPSLHCGCLRRRVMAEPYKIVETRQYTETTYYNGDGVMVEQVENYDHHGYDVSDPMPLTDEERHDYIGDDDDDPQH